MSEANEHGATAAGAALMPEQSKPITAWAIKAPEHLGGKIDNVCVRASRQDAIESCGNWKWAFEHGYRCVQVHITEAMPE